MAMKKILFISLIICTLLLTACGRQRITVADPATVKAYPEIVPVILAWQGMVEAAVNEDCAGFLGYMRITLKLDESVCPAVFDYFSTVPDVDWERTDWSTSGGKAKIYKMNGGSITSFIHNEADDSWRSDEIFWE